MIRPQPWHEEARRLKAVGVPYQEIAERVGRSKTVVTMLFCPKYREAQYANHVTYQKRRRLKDPAWHEQRKAYLRAWHAKQKEQRT
jgi:cyanate lyase